MPNRRFDENTKVRAIRLVREDAGDYDSGWTAMCTSARLEMTAETLVTSFDGHPWNWAAHEAGGRNPAPKRRLTLERRQGSVIRAAATRAGGRGSRYDHMEGERFRHTAQFNRWRAPTVTHVHAPTRSSNTR
jgi:hypothetical protein